MGTNVKKERQQIHVGGGKIVLFTVNEHIQNIFDDGEQPTEACVKKFGNSEFQQKFLDLLLIPQNTL